MLLKTWPYPRWIAHRGAGISAPENTMPAFKLGFESGFRMFECDAKLSADGVVFLLHDATLDRTTNAQGMAHTHAWDALTALDAGSWHSHQFAGAAIPSLEQLAEFCIDTGCQLNIEIKPSPGFEALTGERVALVAKRLWQGQPIPPLLTSFKREALRSALAAAPECPRGLLMDELAHDWREATQSLQCDALACHFPLYSPYFVDEIHRLGLHCLAFTVNDAETAQSLIKMGVDTIITDDMTFALSQPAQRI
ncbi:glycerophosphodiester phosphodiesterase [Zwartia sp.]|uniref:glycerophosphodiester phosphodiesterase n=1 Tax=Zwartia sp. TaxID=2978004 RepID=UPI0027273378|nr:glycerophosphodiester phosphodiesterase [Zwartia sp.]MDO9023659.1 glycerophosphodiester phosphodiesterase [Zwartia sp.]